MANPVGTMPAELDGIIYQTLAFDLAKNATRDLMAAPGVGQQIWVYGGILTGLAIGTAKFQDGAATALTGELHFGAQSQLPMAISPKAHAPYWKCGTNQKLQVVLSADLDLDGSLVVAVVTVV